VTWQPIETAPKDGTKIILYHEKWETFPIASWEWGEGPDEDGTGGWCAWHTVDDRFPGAEDGIIYPSENYMPTHWMPLPEPA
jgi:hypothetical protein